MERHQSLFGLSRSLNLNITEAMWDHLDREWNKRQPKSKEMIRKLQAVLKNKYGATKYLLSSLLELNKPFFFGLRFGKI